MLVVSKLNKLNIFDVENQVHIQCKIDYYLKYFLEINQLGPGKKLKANFYVIKFFKSIFSIYTYIFVKKLSKIILFSIFFYYYITVLYKIDNVSSPKTRKKEFYLQVYPSAWQLKDIKNKLATGGCYTLSIVN